MLYFDSSKTQEGSGVGCVLINLEKNTHFLSYRLEFESTNKTVEYGALVEGLRKAIELNVKKLNFFGDSEIVDTHVRDTIHCFSPHLKWYQSGVWNLISHFNAFNINSILRLQNARTDFLVVYVARSVSTNNKCIIKLIFRPAVPDNVTNMRVFDDDEEIIDFLTNEEKFQRLYY